MSKPKRKGVPLPSCMAVRSREDKTSGRAGARARRASVFTPQTYLRRDKRHSGSGVKVFDLGDLSQAEIVEHLNAMYPDASTPEREVDSDVRRKAEAAPMADRWTEKADHPAELQALIAETVHGKRTITRRWTEVINGRLVSKSDSAEIEERAPATLKEFLRRYPHKADAVVRLLRKIS